MKPTDASAPASSPSRWKALLFRYEVLLLLLLVGEWLLFHHFGTNVNRRGVTVGFGTIDRQMDILRHSCEIGLLALALTPVILTAGIDLSVGSLLGLCAVVFGWLTQGAGLALPLAAALTIAAGALAGGVNAGLVARLRLPPLIVTLGTYSLFRGLAEAFTRGAVTYTDFPASFLFLGQERWLGLPAQAWVFLLVAAADWLLVHATTTGRSLRAIGFSPEGARYAGLPANRRVALVYVLAGVVAQGAGPWTLLPFAPDWRWMLAGNDSPWYPTMRLFRQRTAGDWKPVIEDVAAELSRRARQHERH